MYRIAYLAVALSVLTLAGCGGRGGQGESGQPEAVADTLLPPPVPSGRTVAIDTSLFVDTARVVDENFPDPVRLRSIVISYVNTLQRQDFGQLTKMFAPQDVRCMGRSGLSAAEALESLQAVLVEEQHAAELECEANASEVVIRQLADDVLAEFPLTLYLERTDGSLSEMRQKVTMKLNPDYRIIELTHRTESVYDAAVP